MKYGLWFVVGAALVLCAPFLLPVFWLVTAIYAINVFFALLGAVAKSLDE